MNVLCLKLRSRHAVWHPTNVSSSSSAYIDDNVYVQSSQSSAANRQQSHNIRNGIIKNFCSRVKLKSPTRTMSPPLPITEDTPPDMLAGAMDLHVVLPNGQDMKMSVERSTPMMDLLVQVTTANKISPGGHVIQAIGDRGILPYKPSTPIGALDTWTVHIVSKKQAGNMYARKPMPRPVNQSTPFEQTFRLQVNLPRNQLYVSRVSYKMRLEDVLREVCREKNLDQSKYCFIHPEKLDEELDLSKTFLHYKLQQITLISKSNRPVGLSSADIMALKRYDNDSQHVNNQYYASHSYDGSVSSGSIEGRSLSPVRSDESSGSPTIPKTTTILGRPLRKRRPAPKPPSVQNGERNSKHVTATETLTISHSRNSSDSSGYHESSVLSESPESNSNSLANSLPRRSKLPSGEPHVSELTTHQRPRSSKYTNGKIGNNLSRSLSNLAVIGNRKANMLSNGMKHKEYSTSTTSLASIPGKKKKAPAPPPPTSARSLLSLKEEETSLADYPAAVQVPVETPQKSRTLPAIAKLSDVVAVPSSSECSRLQDHDSTPSKNSCPSHAVDDSSRHRVEPHLSVDEVDSASVPVIDSAVKSQPVRHEKSKEEFTMDDDEIDRIFSDATKDYESTVLPAVESSSETCTTKYTTSNDNRKTSSSSDDRIDNSLHHWEYKLPSPPKAFRDSECDPSASTRNTNDIVEERKSSAEPTNNGVNVKYDSAAENAKHTVVGVRGQSKRSGGTTMVKNVGGDSCVPIKSRSPTVTNTAPRHDDLERAARISKEAVEESRSRTLTRCDQSAFDTSNCDTYMSTNDSGLGSDDSIPSMSEGRYGTEDACCYAVAGKAKNERAEPRLSDRRNTLQNFTITTYQHSNSKPTEIFHDDSVKTSKTTLLAQNKHPFVRPSDENDTAAAAAVTATAGLSRHCSFSTEKASNSMVKRSKSHISLLSGNFTKFSRLNKLNNGTRAYSEEDASAVSASTENLSRCDEELKATNGCATTHLRRSTSEDGVNKDCGTTGECTKWEEHESRTVVLDTMKRVEELQSVQVLKGILPQINRSQPQQTYIPSSSSATKSVPAEQTVSSVNRPTVTIRTRPSIDHQPAVNLQSWNERPKRQVSIKTDRDYVFGNHRRVSDGDSRDHTTAADRTGSSSAPHRECGVESADRVPIVRAVEFKKPYVQQTSATDPAPRCGSQQRSADAVKPKQRPSSSYLFGEHMATINDEEVPPRSANTFENEIHNLKNASSSSSAAKRYSVGRMNELSHEVCNGRVENYTFKTYKNKYGAGSGRRSENGGVSTTFVNGESCKGNQNFVEPNAVGKCAYKTFISNSPKDGGAIVTMKAVAAVPPPAPVPPPSSYLRSTTSQKCRPSQRASFVANEDPRDTLFASIKNFNRDNLRKLHA